MGKNKNKQPKEKKEKALTGKQELYMIAELEAKQLDAVCGGVESEDSDEEQDISQFKHIYKSVEVQPRFNLGDYKS